MEREKTKIIAILICVFAYVLAAFAGIFFVRHLWWGSSHPIVVIGVADLVATVVIFIFSVIFDNSSFYDPYWSVAPIFFVFFYFFFMTPESGSPLRRMLVLLFVTVWGIRLTVNFLLHWRGLDHEDWRYENFRENARRGYWPVSFIGIHLFPTIIVFLGSLSLYPALVASSRGFSVIDIAAVIVTAGAILTEAVADGQLRRFSLNNDGSRTVLTEGLWGASRHPNYFGEISFWWGLFLFGLAANPAYWWTVAGPLLITLMFRFISLPMIEKRMLARRPEFEEVRENTSAIVPWPFQKKS